MLNALVVLLLSQVAAPVVALPLLLRSISRHDEAPQLRVRHAYAAVLAGARRRSASSALQYSRALAGGPSSALQYSRALAGGPRTRARGAAESRLAASTPRRRARRHRAARSPSACVPPAACRTRSILRDTQARSGRAAPACAGCGARQSKGAGRQHQLRTDVASDRAVEAAMHHPGGQLALAKQHRHEQAHPELRGAFRRRVLRGGLRRAVHVAKGLLRPAAVHDRDLNRLAAVPSELGRAGSAAAHELPGPR